MTIEWKRGRKMWTANGVADAGSWSASITVGDGGPFGAIYFYELLFASGKRSSGGGPDLTGVQAAVARELIDANRKEREKVTAVLTGLRGAMQSADDPVRHAGPRDRSARRKPR